MNYCNCNSNCNYSNCNYSNNLYNTMFSMVLGSN